MALHVHNLAPTPQVKRDCDGCGTGGDWSVRITAERASDLPPMPAEGEDGWSGEAPDRLSLLFYLGDERVSAPIRTAN